MFYVKEKGKEKSREKKRDKRTFEFVDKEQDSGCNLAAQTSVYRSLNITDITLPFGFG